MNITTRLYPRRRHHRAAVFLVSAALFAGLFPATSVSAHAQVVSVSPANGAQLATAPTSVSVLFNEPVAATAAKVQLLDTSGKIVPAKFTTTATKDGFTLTPNKRLPRGLYALRFSVVSADGHVVAQASAFQVGSRPTGGPMQVKFVQGSLNQRVGFSSDRAGTVALTLPPGTGTVEFRHKILGATMVFEPQNSSLTVVLPFTGTWNVTLVLRPDKFTEQRLLASFSLR